MIQANGVIGLIDLVEGMDILDLLSELTTLRSVTGLTSSPLGRAAEETKDSKEAKAPNEWETASGPVTTEEHFQLRVNEWQKRVKTGDIPPIKT